MSTPIVLVVAEEAALCRAGQRNQIRARASDALAAKKPSPHDRIDDLARKLGITK